MTKILIKGQPFALTPSQLIQSGGEGMVFELNDTAVKLYHQPQRYHHEKLNDWLNSGMSIRLPTNILGPCELVQDNRKRFIGFQMPRLPATSQAVNRLSKPLSWQKLNLNASHVVTLFQEIHNSLCQLHQQGVIVGDLNDQNLFFQQSLTNSRKSANGGGQSTIRAYWIDVDSYQFNRHPCPVAMQAFLDPKLYRVGDLKQKPYFTQLTDWFAYFTLLIKSLLQVHPYGGVHRSQKTLQARAMAGVSILDPAVTYPKRARPLDTLSDELLHHVHLVFDKGKRMPFPAHLLNQYATTLIACPQCGLTYPSQRPDCPACRRQTPVTRRPTINRSFQERLIMQVDGFIEYVAIQPNGRIFAVVRTGKGYKLVRAGIGGLIDEMILFRGQSHYRFGFFYQHGTGHYLVINPADSHQLLVLDVGGLKPKQVTMIETAKFRGSAVFATTQNHLYRIAGSWIMRGGIQHGHYVEDAIATGHTAQTQFWASPYNEIIAGYHRVLSEYHFFLIDGGKISHEILVPSPTRGESMAEAAIAFGPKSVAVMMTIAKKGRFRAMTHISDLQGRLQHSFSPPLDTPMMDIQPHIYPFTADPTRPAPPFTLLPSSLDLSDGDILYVHPGGTLIRHPDRLSLLGR